MPNTDAPAPDTAPRQRHPRSTSRPWAPVSESRDPDEHTAEHDESHLVRGYD